MIVLDFPRLAKVVEEQPISVEEQKKFILEKSKLEREDSTLGTKIKELDKPTPTSHTIQKEPTNTFFTKANSRCCVFNRPVLGGGWDRTTTRGVDITTSTSRTRPEVLKRGNIGPVENVETKFFAPHADAPGRVHPSHDAARGGLESSGRDKE